MSPSWGISTSPSSRLGRFSLSGLLATAGTGIALLLAAVPVMAAAPVVDSLTASPSVVLPGATSTISLTAHDPDCLSTCSTGCGLYLRHDLTTWTADGGTLPTIDYGTSGSPYATSATWQAPNTEGIYTIEISISDSATFLCGGRQTITTSIPIQVSLTPNQAPVIDSLVADPVQISPSGTSALTCAASDPDGDSLTYSWATGFGILTDLGAGAASFTAAAPGVATVSCTATDSLGAPASRSVVVSVTDATPASAVAGGLAAPVRLAVGPGGELFVVDLGAGGLMVSNIFGDRVGGFIPMSEATAVAVDWNGDLLVGTRHGAATLRADGSNLRWLPLADGQDDVADVATDPVNRRYVVLHSSTGLVAVYDAGGSLDSTFGSTGDAPGQVNNPTGVAVSPSGQIVVADSGHGLVQVFGADGAHQFAFGGIGNGASEFIQLDGVAVAATGLIYATDAFTSRVKVFNPDGSLREIVGSFGDSPGQLRTPAGVAVADAWSGLVVASLNTRRVEIFALGGADFDLPATTLFPTGLSFSEQAVLSTSDSQTVTVTNSGAVPVTFYEAEASPGFTASVGCASVLMPGDSCPIAVQFAPTSAGPTFGTLTVADSSAGSPHQVALFGNGVAQPIVALTLSPRRVEFEAQMVGTIGPPQSFTLTNTGTAALSLASISASAGFAIGSGCGSTLPPGASCTFGVGFAPTSAGWTDGLLAVASNAPTSPDLVSLRGYGAATPALVLPRPVVSLGDWPVGQTSAPVVVTVANAGDGVLNFSSIAVSGDFTLVDGCGSSLPPTTACLLTLRFTPAGVGFRPGHLIVASNDPDGIQAVDLAGVGLGAPVATASVPRLSFGTAYVGESSVAQALLVANTGTADLAVIRVAVEGPQAGDFTVVSDACTGITLVPSASCQLELAFAPTRDELRSATATVTTDADGSPLAVTLEGTGAYVTTTLGSGIDPADGVFCPGDEGMVADAFSLTVNHDHDLIEWVSIELSETAAKTLSEVRITNLDGSLVYGRTAITPESTRVVVELAITSTEVTTDYAVVLVPRAHADLQDPPGQEHSLAARVEFIGSLNLSDGSDTASTVVTLDNLSPGVATWSSVAAQGADVLLAWSAPADHDHDGFVVVRTAAADPVVRPAEGVIYQVGDALGTGVVVYDGTGTSTVDVAVPAGESFAYHLFATDLCGNVSAGWATASLDSAIFASGFESGDLLEWSFATAKTAFSPPSIDFGEAVVGATAPSVVATLTNWGHEAIDLGTFSLLGDDGYQFAIGGDSCSGLRLETGGTCHLEILLLTIDPGSFTATVECPGWGPDGPETIAADVVGAVVLP